MSSESIIMFYASDNNYHRGYASTRRCWFVAEYLESTLYDIEYVKDSIDLLSSGHFDDLYYGPVVTPDYINGVLNLSLGGYPSDQEESIAPKLLCNVLKQWLQVVAGKPNYIKMDIDWENETIVMQGLEAWDGAMTSHDKSILKKR